jgi:hypothetical protein
VTSLDRLLQQLGGDGRPSRDTFFEQYGLRQNPFPASRTIIREVMYNQDEGLTRFGTVVREITVSSEPRRRAIGVLGGTGGGKTHFLHHCRWLLEQVCDLRGETFVFVDFIAGEGRARDIVAEAFRAADDACGGDFLATLVNRVAKHEQRDSLIDAIEQDDFKGAIRQLVRATQRDFTPLGRDGQYDYERLRESCRRWLHGGSLSATEQKYLGVYGRMTTASMATRVFREAFTLARSVAVVDGILLSLDEIETLFTGALRTSQYQGFLQDTRYLYDEAVRGDRGFSFIIVSAATANGARSLREVNYPVFQRLGFEEGSRIQLNPITGAEEARRFAQVYVAHEHEMWQKERGQPRSERSAGDVLSDEEVANAFQRATSGATVELRTGRVNQAPLLEALHESVNAKRKGSVD